MAAGHQCAPRSSDVRNDAGSCADAVHQTNASPSGMDRLRSGIELASLAFSTATATFPDRQSRSLVSYAHESCPFRSVIHTQLELNMLIRRSVRPALDDVKQISYIQHDYLERMRGWRCRG